MLEFMKLFWCAFTKAKILNRWHHTQFISQSLDAHYCSQSDILFEKKRNNIIKGEPKLFNKPVYSDRNSYYWNTNQIGAFESATYSKCMQFAYLSFSIFQKKTIDRRSASEEKYSKSLPDREALGRPRPTQFLTKLTPKPHLRQMRSQTSSLLSSTSITDTSDEDDEGEEIHSYNERRHRRHQWF